MSPRRTVARIANSLLRGFGLELSKVALDFDARLESPRHLQFLFDALAEPIERWINTQQLFTLCSRPALVKPDIERFYHEYLGSPFRVQVGASRFNNLLWLYLLARMLRPTVIIDSGTYMGASAWALSLGSPDSPVHSFDPDLSRLKLKRPGIQYIQADWTTFDIKSCDVSRGLCYFDDHVDQVGRLIQAAERGFSFVIFDDDFPVTSFVSMAHDGLALPKVEFALDDRLGDEEVISWFDRGQKRSWQVNRSYLDKGRSVIRATDRLPDISSATGIQQTPYRVVALRNNGSSSSSWIPSPNQTKPSRPSPSITE
jgi:hypothetical protein